MEAKSLASSSDVGWVVLDEPSGPSGSSKSGPQFSSNWGEGIDVGSGWVALFFGPRISSADGVLVMEWVWLGKEDDLLNTAAFIGLYWAGGTGKSCWLGASEGSWVATHTAEEFPPHESGFVWVWFETVMDSAE